MNYKDFIEYLKDRAKFSIALVNNISCPVYNDHGQKPCILLDSLFSKNENLINKALLTDLYPLWSGYLSRDEEYLIFDPRSELRKK